MYRYKYNSSSNNIVIIIIIIIIVHNGILKIVKFNKQIIKIFYNLDFVAFAIVV